MECPNCHHWNEAGARFCEECGFELTGAAAAPAKVSITGGVNPPPNAPPSLGDLIGTPADSGHEHIPEPPPQILVAPDAPSASAAQYSGARLVLDATGSVFKLGDTTVVGRESPTLQIDFDGYPEGKYVSHRHAQITKTAGVFYLEDLGSSNATRVNGAKLSAGQSEPLHEGDKVRFGKIELTFHES